MHVTYRPAIASDIHDVAMAHQAAHRETWRGLVADRDLHVAPLEELVETWSARLAHPALHVVVAECEGQIIGAGACGTVGDEGLIIDILVLKHMQCRGVGTRLMGLMACALQARGHRSVSLWAPERNVAAIVFCRAIGGEIVDAQAQHGASGLPALRLRWDDLDELAFWNGSVSQSHRAQTPQARGGRSPSAAARTTAPDADPPASGAPPRD